MALGRDAVVITTLDEGGPLPLSRWLRVLEGAGRVHRFTVSPAEWKLLAAHPLADSAIGRRLLRCVDAFPPPVVAVLGHERAGQPSRDAAQAEVMRIVRAVESCDPAARVRGFWMTDEGSTGCLHTDGADPTPVQQRPEASDPPSQVEREEEVLT
jgi:hypothetical protein